MRIDSAFPSAYLKAADLQGRNVTVTMNYVKMEDIGGDHKPILYFIGKEKGLVLNKTNSNNIGSVYGYETDEWTGKPIELFPAMVDFQGKSVEAIRVRVPRGAPQHSTQQASAQGGVNVTGHPYGPNGNGHPTGAPAPRTGGSAAMPDDEIPFSPF